MSAFRLVCAGCGTAVPPVDVDPYPFRCRRADTSLDVDHVLTKLLGDEPPGWPESRSAKAGGRGPQSGEEVNPFLRYRRLLYSYGAASGFGQTDDHGFVRLVERLDDAVFAVSGRRFRITPFGRSPALSTALGFSEGAGVWVKDETGNVSGSHKARHLAGIVLYLLRVVRDTSPELAIASCGNAALAAAVLARAAGWPLRTFVPPNANPVILERLRNLGSTLVVCPRQPGEAGDPCYLRFKDALAEGALPFCCQGPDNGLTIEGGETLAYEMVDALGADALDAIVIQVGGGALASACIQGLERAVAVGQLRKMPRIYTVQTQGAAPLARAYGRVAERVEKSGIEEALRYAAAHRSAYMWPWETEPHSVAHGILDDETYDWLAVAKGMLETGGQPVVVDEPTLQRANALGREATGINVDHTGSAGLAGLIALRARGEIAEDERVAVLFSGVSRG